MTSQCRLHHQYTPFLPEEALEGMSTRPSRSLMSSQAGGGG